jgi:hypothetical protein
MDTKILKVGQRVYMINGPYINRGKVVKITPSGVEVQTFRYGQPDELFRFDNEGNELEESCRDRGLGRLGPDPAFLPWHLADYKELTAEEREALESS